MPTDRRTAALRSRFGLSAASPPVVFSPTRSRIVWGGLGAVPSKSVKPESAAAKPFPVVSDRAAPPPIVESAVPRDEAAAEFVEWLGRSYPGVVEALLEALGVESVIARDGALGQAEEKTLVSQLLDLAQGVLPAYLQYEQQKEVLAIQLERAKAGLPPLETGQYAPSVQIGLDGETIQRLADEATQRAAAAASSPLPWLLIGGGILAAIALRQPKRRRRA